MTVDANTRSEASVGRLTRSGLLGRHRGIAIGLSAILAVLIASTWLVFPYFFEGRTILSDVGVSVQAERRAKSVSIAQHLTRYADGPGEAEVDVVYATPTYFDVADKARMVDEYRPDLYHVFVVNEATHAIDLPMELPDVKLIVDGQEFSPADIEGPIDTNHHRSTTVRFDRVNANGIAIITDSSAQIELRLSSGWDSERTARSAVWALPITYPEELISPAIWSPVLVLALSAGLLSAVLTPCLLQLIVVYFATLAGLGAEELNRTGVAAAATSRQVFLIALAFVAGFMILYTGAGAVIGYAGKSAQLMFAESSRSVGIVSGILMIGLGIWVGARARAPVVCKIAMPGVAQRFDKGGLVRSALLAAGFSLGCMACFSGAIIATLLVYVGALGSATIGASVMFVFSLGVAVPFLAAALLLSRMTPMLGHISRYAPYMGFAGMVVIIAFGVVLLTDNFHTLSNIIYPWLGLS